MVNHIHGTYTKIKGASDGDGPGLPAGRGWIDVVRRGERSVVTRALATSPLRLLTPRNHGRGAWIYTATYGGGLLGGDDIRLDVSVGAGATAMMSTQASTKVYRSNREASSELRAHVESDALLAVLPDPVVCFASATFRQLQRIDLDAGGSLIFMDWLSSGRRARDERWQFDGYSSRVEIVQNGCTAILDALTLDAAAGDVGDRMGRFNVLCAIVLLGPLLAAPAAHGLSRIAAMPLEKRAGRLVAASPINRGSDGCLIRIAGVSFEAVASAAREHLRFVPSLLGDDPWARRL
jgi:urease accessory protein